MLSWETHRPIFQFEGYSWKSTLSDGSEAVLLLYARDAEIRVFLEVWKNRDKIFDKSDRIGFSSSDTIIYKFASQAKKWAEDLVLSPMDLLVTGLHALK